MMNLTSATTQEIFQQPQIWREHADHLAILARQCQHWQTSIQNGGFEQIWFMGAGSSDYVGASLVPWLNERTRSRRFMAIPTTSFITDPDAYLASVNDRARLLAVLIGRSGDSPETIGCANILDQLATPSKRLHLSCNADSFLAKTQPAGGHSIILPPECNDRGFAMTSSFTTMMLVLLASFDPSPPQPIADLCRALADAAQSCLSQSSPQNWVKGLMAINPPERAVFLGSGALAVIAREGALKALELTGGRIACLAETPMGFRHGPKAFVSPATKVFLLASPEPAIARYEQDLFHEIQTLYGADIIHSIGVVADKATAKSTAKSAPEFQVPLVGDVAWSMPLYCLAVQILAAHWSLSYGLNIDNPFQDGKLTRVVGGVTLYPPNSGNSKPRRTESGQKSKPAVIGGMDLGGSKLEAALFDGDLQEITRQRWLIRGLDYPNLLDKMGEAAAWLDQAAYQRGLAANSAASDTLNPPKIPIGIGVPGVIDATTRLAVTSNLPASGKPFRQDLIAKLGRNFEMGNDSGLLALSEANGGAGAGFTTVFGLIIGTGIGGGFCLNGRPHQGLNGAASLMTSEVGHIRLSCEKLLAKAASLTEIPCGCGRVGCIETLVSGPGLTRLGEYFSGQTLTAAEIADAAINDPQGQSGLTQAFDLWLDLLGELAKAIQLAIDPDVIILGGGLSQIGGLPALMTERLAKICLKSLKLPRIGVGKFGAASGVRGAAWLAYHNANSDANPPHITG